MTTTALSSSIRLGSSFTVCLVLPQQKLDNSDKLCSTVTHVPNQYVLAAQTVSATFRQVLTCLEHVSESTTPQEYLLISYM